MIKCNEHKVNIDHIEQTVIENFNRYRRNLH